MGLFLRKDILIEFTDKVIIITGACSGIGKMLCDTFYEQQAKVIRFDINKEQLNSEDDYIVDIRDYKCIENAVNDVINKYHKIDILINFAGGASSSVLGENKSFEELSINSIMGHRCELKRPFIYG